MAAVMCPSQGAEILDAVTLAVTIFDPRRVLLVADRERVEGRTVSGSLARWVLALHGLIQAAVDVSAPGEVVLVGIMGSAGAARVVIRDRGRRTWIAELDDGVDASAKDAAREILAGAGGRLWVTRDADGLGASVHLLVPTVERTGAAATVEDGVLAAA